MDKFAITHKDAALIYNHIQSKKRSPKNQFLKRIKVMDWINKKVSKTDSGIIAIHQHNLAKKLGIGVAQINSIINELAFNLHIIQKEHVHIAGITSCGYSTINKWDTGEYIHVHCPVNALDNISTFLQNDNDNEFVNQYLSNMDKIYIPYFIKSSNDFYTAILLDNSTGLPVANYISYIPYDSDKELDIVNEPVELYNIPVKEQRKWINNLGIITQPNKDNRVYQILTQTSSVYRRNFKWKHDNELLDLLQTDMKSAQVVLSYHKFRMETKQEEPFIKEHIDNGTVYKVMMEILEKTDRDEFKKELFKDFLFAGHWWMSRKKNMISQMIKDMYPNYWKWVYQTKKKTSSSEFSHMITRLEWKFIRNTLKELYGEGVPCVSLHDSIIYPESIDPLYIEEKLNVVARRTFGSIIPIKSSNL